MITPCLRSFCVALTVVALALWAAYVVNIAENVRAIVRGLQSTPSTERAMAAFLAATVADRAALQQWYGPEPANATASSAVHVLNKLGVHVARADLDTLVASVDLGMDGTVSAMEAAYGAAAGVMYMAAAADGAAARKLGRTGTGMALCRVFAAITADAVGESHDADGFDPCADKALMDRARTQRARKGLQERHPAAMAAVTNIVAEGAVALAAEGVHTWFDSVLDYDGAGVTLGRVEGVTALWLLYNGQGAQMKRAQPLVAKAFAIGDLDGNGVITRTELLAAIQQEADRVKE